MKRVCPQCGGSGWYCQNTSSTTSNFLEKCSLCQGTGVVEVVTKLYSFDIKERNGKNTYLFNINVLTDSYAEAKKKAMEIFKDIQKQEKYKGKPKIELNEVSEDVGC